MRQQRRFRLQSLAHPEQRLDRAGFAQGAQRRAETDQRRGDDQEIGASYRRFEIGCDSQRVRERITGQKAPVFTVFQHVSRDVFLTRPQSDLVPRAERDRQRCSPRPGSDNRYVQA